MRSLRIVVSCLMVFGAMSIVASSASAEEHVEVEGCSTEHQCLIVGHSDSVVAGEWELTCEHTWLISVDGTGNTKVMFVGIRGNAQCNKSSLPSGLPWNGLICATDEEGESWSFTNHVYEAWVESAPWYDLLPGNIDLGLKGTFEGELLTANGFKITKVESENSVTLKGSFEIVNPEPYGWVDGVNTQEKFVILEEEIKNEEESGGVLKTSLKIRGDESPGCS